MKLLIDIAMDNAAFEECPNLEAARILEDYAKELKWGLTITEVNLKDLNGAKVGKAVIELE